MILYKQFITLKHLNCIYYNKYIVYYHLSTLMTYSIGNLTKQIVSANINQKAIEIQKGSNSKIVFIYILCLKKLMLKTFYKSKINFLCFSQ